MFLALWLIIQFWSCSTRKVRKLSGYRHTAFAWENARNLEADKVDAASASSLIKVNMSVYIDWCLHVRILCNQNNHLFELLPLPPATSLASIALQRSNRSVTVLVIPPYTKKVQVYVRSDDVHDNTSPRQNSRWKHTSSLLFLSPVSPAMNECIGR